MVPEKRSRKKVEVFNPHPPGSRHQMMSERSRKIQAKKDVDTSKIKNRDRMRDARKKQKEDDPVQSSKAKNPKNKKITKKSK